MGQIKPPRQLHQMLTPIAHTFCTFLAQSVPIVQGLVAQFRYILYGFISAKHMRYGYKKETIVTSRNRHYITNDQSVANHISVKWKSRMPP